MSDWGNHDEDELTKESIFSWIGREGCLVNGTISLWKSDNRARMSASTPRVAWASLSRGLGASTNCHPRYVVKSLQLMLLHSDKL
jgi:hypothetical protein